MQHISSDATGEVVTLWMQTAKILGKRIFLKADKNIVNPQQMHALFIVSEHNGITMKELATFLGITSPSTTSLVNRLVRMKWVTRKMDPENRRLVRITMAAAGVKIMNSSMQLRSEAMREVLALLTPEDRKDFARVLRNLYKALTQHSV